ncbi:hypothetical protein ANN_20020 [Periplaneta americana]|uniref:Uncharacterized protein n=1 Tax=Periplaneta americana TaxID=6978 RepID=A0ABQ8SBX3_PERAM|nr:hypothetical protein ANN_20020 [Periplaneta americana]
MAQPEANDYQLERKYRVVSMMIPSAVLASFHNPISLPNVAPQIHHDVEWPPVAYTGRNFMKGMMSKTTTLWISLVAYILNAPIEVYNLLDIRRDIKKSANNFMLALLPEKSTLQYEKEYEEFDGPLAGLCEWHMAMNLRVPCLKAIYFESILVAFRSFPQSRIRNNLYPKKRYVNLYCGFPIFHKCILCIDIQHYSTHRFKCFGYNTTVNTETLSPKVRLSYAPKFKCIYRELHACRLPLLLENDVQHIAGSYCNLKLCKKWKKISDKSFRKRRKRRLAEYFETKLLRVYCLNYS